MSAQTARDRPFPTHSAVGTLLRHWREARRLSQLALALDAGISARHLSYVETGRSRPSRDMLLRLAETLDIPLRERNTLLVAGGFAPRYFESTLGAPAMKQVRDAIALILRHQEPYPAFVLGRSWDILETNQAAARCTRFLLGHEPTEPNMIRLLLDPYGLRPVLGNFEETARDLLRHLHRQAAAAPGDTQARALLDEVLAYPDVSALWRERDLGAPGTPLFTTVFRRDGVELRFFSTLTMFGTPHDVALEELHIECSFPADDATAEECRRRFAS